MPRIELIQVRRGTAAAWAAQETSGAALLPGEPAYITDTQKMVIGDGVTKVASLPQFGASGVTSVVGQTGAVTDAQILASAAIANALSGKAAVSHKHPASDLASGTVATARLGSGTASSSTYLRGDQTWAAGVASVVGQTGAVTGAQIVADSSVSTAFAGKLGATAQAVDSAKVGGVTVTGTPTVGQTPVATSGTAATWQTPAGGGGAVSSVVGQTGAVTGTQILADSTVSAALAAKAPTASPTFTGTVTVPTPTNNTDAATKNYVDTTASAGTPDANATTKGKVQLAGHLSGTAASPTVIATSLASPLPIAQGGTAATSAGAALTSLGAAPVSHAHPATDITSGTIATARLGSGTASSSTFLRGDQTWATVSGGSGSTAFIDATASPYSASGAGTGNQLTALHAARDAAIAANLPLYIPPGVYAIAGSLDLRAPGLRTFGAGPRRTIIRQSTTNTPVMLVGGQENSVTDLGVDWATQPTTGHANSVGILCHDLFMGYYARLYVGPSYISIGIAQTEWPVGNGQNTAFSTKFDTVRCLGWRQTALDLRSYVGASTPCHLSNVYLHNNPSGSPETSADCAVLIQGYDGIKFDVLNIEQCVFASGKSALVVNGAAATIDNLHVENVTLSGYGASLINAYDRALILVRALEIQATTFSNSAVPQSILSTGGGSGTGTSTVMPRIHLDSFRWLGGNPAPTTPAQFYLHRSSDSTAARVVVTLNDPRAPVAALGDNGGAETQLLVDTETGEARAWATPGHPIPGITGTPTTCTTGTTTVVAAPTTGRRVVKGVTIHAPTAGASVVVTAAGTAIATLDFATAGVKSLDLVVPLAATETVTVTVTGSTVYVLAVSGDRRDTTVTRHGLTVGATSGTLVASGGARTITHLLVANNGSAPATATVQVGSGYVLNALPVPARGLFSLVFPVPIPASTAVTWAGDGTNTITIMAAGY